MKTEAIEVESKRKEGPPPTKLNKYALACGLLASTNSVLLGYGNHFSDVGSDMDPDRSIRVLNLGLILPGLRKLNPITRSEDFLLSLLDIPYLDLHRIIIKINIFITIFSSSQIVSDIGVISGAVLYIRETLKISSVQEEILVGSLNVCSLIGSLLSGKTSDLIGRRYTIVLAAGTFFVGALLMGLAPSYPFLMAGRVVAGIGVGYSLMIAPVYTAEISPAMTRGFLSSLPEVFITVGILLGYVVNYAFSGILKEWNWRVMLLLAAVPAVAIGMGVVVMPESPRWLVMKKRLEEAKRVLVKTSESEEEAEVRLAEITRAWDLHESSDWQGQGVWKELLWQPARATRRVLVAAIGINFFMQASGNDAVIYYLPEVFKAAGINKKKLLFAINVIMGASKATFVMISAFFLDKYGRRPLLLLGSAGMVVSLSILGLGSMFLEHSTHRPTWAIIVSVIAVCFDVSFFSVGLGPITWVYSSEVFPQRLRAQGTSLAVSVNRLVSGLVSMTFLSISRKITFGGMFFVLAGVMVMGTLFFFFCMPETKGKSLEEIGELFEDNKTKDKGREMT